MKPSYLFIVFFLAVAPLPGANEVPRLHDEYDPAKWPQVELKLQQAAILKDIFDSGLRPYRHPGLENTLLEVKHVNITFKLASGKTLPLLTTELMNITPFPDGEIATLEGFTPALGLEDARTEMMKWLPYGTNGRSEVDLNKFLEAVRTDFKEFDGPAMGLNHGCSILWTEPGWKQRGGGGQVIVWFRKTGRLAQPLRIYIKLTWSSNRPAKLRGVYRPLPIDPPPGYEMVDMTPPKKIGPDSLVEIMRALDLDTGESPEAVAEQRRNGERPPLQGGRNSKTKPPLSSISLVTSQEARSGIFVKIALGIAAASLLAWWYLKRRQSAG